MNFRDFTLYQLSYILIVFVLSCTFWKKVRKTSAHGRTSRSLLLLVNCLAGNRQYNSSVPCLPLQAFLPSAGCCGSHCVRQFWKNIIAVLRLDGPRTMACCRHGSPLCCLRCRFRFQRRITFAMECSANFSAYNANIKQKPAPLKTIA